MNRLEIEAIRALPEEYVRDGTLVAEFNGRVLAANPELPPIMFAKGAGWEPLRLEEATALQRPLPVKLETKA